MIGLIDIETHSATFGVANEAAAEFELRARRRDTRDPHQRIERVTDGARPNGFRRATRHRAG